MPLAPGSIRIDASEMAIEAANSNNARSNNSNTNTGSSSHNYTGKNDDNRGCSHRSS